MKSVELFIENSSYPTLGRLDSVSYPQIGSIIYHFFGGPVYPKSDDYGRSWGNFSVQDTYSLNTDYSDILKAEINIGDIVQFNPFGSSLVIYDKGSKSNALFLTERCNSRCIMCPQPPKNQGDHVDLSIATAKLISEEMDTIGITGGEPTIAWIGLIHVLSVLKNCHPNSRIELLTNARIFHQYHKAKELSETRKEKIVVCIPLYSDIHSIHDAVVGVKGAFWQTVEGIYNLERFKMPIELRIVVLKQNYERLNDWAEYVYRHFPFVQHIAIMGLEPEGYALDNIDQVWVDPLDYADQLSNAIRTIDRRAMNVSIYNHQLCTIPETLWKYAKKSISEWKNFFFKECTTCTLQQMCGGFFESAALKHSRGIAPFLS